MLVSISLSQYHMLLFNTGARGADSQALPPAVDPRGLFDRPSTAVGAGGLDDAAADTTPDREYDAWAAMTRRYGKSARSGGDAAPSDPVAEAKGATAEDPVVGNDDSPPPTATGESQAPDGDDGSGGAIGAEPGATPGDNSGTSRGTDGTGDGGTSGDTTGGGSGGGGLLGTLLGR